jgi:hypothetical protein
MLAGAGRLQIAGPFPMGPVCPAHRQANVGYRSMPWAPGHLHPARLPISPGDSMGGLNRRDRPGHQPDARSPFDLRRRRESSQLRRTGLRGVFFDTYGLVPA